jgi:hypothetical protein
VVSVSWLTSPKALLACLVALLVVTVGVAASTSSASFGAYNPAWDGASGLQERADVAGAESRLVLNVTAYDTVDPDETVAVVLTPDRAYTPAEAAQLRRFVERGGTLVVAEDFGRHSNALLAAIGTNISVDGRLLRDERYYYRSPNITVANNVSDHPLTEGVDQLTLNHGTTLIVNRSQDTDTDTDTETETDTDTEILVNSSSLAYLDTNRNAQLDSGETLERRPVAAVEPVGEGSVVVVSDPSLLINAMLERPGNQQFVDNVFGAHEQVLLDYSHAEALPPLSYAFVLVQDSRGLQVLLGLGALVVSVLGVRTRPLASGGDVDEEGSPVPTDRLVAGLRAKHPEWDEERIERVANAWKRGRDDR